MKQYWLVKRLGSCYTFLKRKKEGRRKLMAAAVASPSQLLNAVQRLGVAYHFEGEIEEALQHIYDSFHDVNDMDGDEREICI